MDKICEGCGENFDATKAQRFCRPDCRRLVRGNQKWIKEEKSKKPRALKNFNFGKTF